jgi:hypothetical protein
MQAEEKNEPTKQASTPHDADAKKELSDSELASIAAGLAPPPLRREMIRRDEQFGAHK